MFISYLNLVSLLVSGHFSFQQWQMQGLCESSYSGSGGCVITDKRIYLIGFSQILKKSVNS